MIGPYDPGAIVVCKDAENSAGLLTAGERYTIDGLTWDRRGVRLREVAVPPPSSGFRLSRFIPDHQGDGVAGAESVLAIYEACIARDGPPKTINCRI